MHRSGVYSHQTTMEDRELYRRILGIENPWRVASVDLRLAPREVHIHLTHEDLPAWPCAECGTPSKLYDHQPERQWRHLDTCQYRTILHAEPPRSQCPTHGVRVVKLPWAEPSSRFTALFEALAIAWLKAASQKAVGEQLGLSWDEIHGIMERAVKRGLARRQAEPIRHLGVDEKAFRKGHKYMTVVNDLDARAGSVRGRRPQTGESGRFLGDADGGAEERDRGRGHGHVGPVCELGARACGRRRQEDRLRQVPRGAASGQGRGRSASQREQSPAGRRRRPAEGHALRLAAQPGDDGPGRPPGLCRLTPERTEDRPRLGLERDRHEPVHLRL